MYIFVKNKIIKNSIVQQQIHLCLHHSALLSFFRYTNAGKSHILHQNKLYIQLLDCVVDKLKKVIKQCLDEFLYKSPTKSII